MAAVFQRFERDGLHFEYPENWQIEQSEAEDGWAVIVQSPGTAFMLVSVHDQRPSVEELLEASLVALREEYPDLEMETATETIAGYRAPGFDIQFFSMDLTNSCWTRSFRTPRRSVLILCQTNDAELEEVEPIFQTMRETMEVAEKGSGRQTGPTAEEQED
ncbi:MAG: hypothetical protein C4297_06750 [Gemmataceae bacterium]